MTGCCEDCEDSSTSQRASFGEAPSGKRDQASLSSAEAANAERQPASSDASKAAYTETAAAFDTAAKGSLFFDLWGEINVEV